MNSATLHTVLVGDPATPEVAVDAAARVAMLRGDFSLSPGSVPPERRLMIAIVRDALRCIEKYRHARDLRGKRRFEQEARWMLSNDTSRVHAFVRVCEALDLEPAAVRRSIGLTTVEVQNRRAPRATVAASALKARRLPC